MISPFKKNFDKRLFCLLLCALTFSSYSQTSLVQHSALLTQASPESGGISSERLDKISEMLKAAIEKEHIPGAVALIAKDGKII